MMRKFLAATALALATAAPAGAATFSMSFTDPTLAVVDNNFSSNLANLDPSLGGPLSSFVTSTTSVLTLDAAATIEFYYLGSESGYHNTFTAGTGADQISYTENSEASEYFFDSLLSTAQYIGSVAYGAGQITDWNFTTSGVGDGGANAALGQDGFGFFLPASLTGQSWSGNQMIFGYDDQNTTNPVDDDNHDDFMVYARISAVPESATWAMLLAGFATIGAAMRRRGSGFRTQQAV